MRIIMTILVHSQDKQTILQANRQRKKEKKAMVFDIYRLKMEVWSLIEAQVKINREINKTKNKSN